MATQRAARAGIGTPYNARYAGGAEPLSGGAHDSLRQPPAGTPAPSPPSFPGWARRSVGRGQSRCAMGAGELFKFRPLDKDDAVPRVRKAADGGKCDGGLGRNRYTVQRSLRWLSRTAVRGAHDSVRPPPAGTPAPRLIPGAGYGEMAAFDKLKLEGDEQIGVNIVKRALVEPLRQIAENAGEEDAIVLGKVNDSKDPNYGFNALTSGYEDLVKAGARPDQGRAHCPAERRLDRVVDADHRSACGGDSGRAGGASTRTLPPGD
jgi:hypothetical protein